MFEIIEKSNKSMEVIENDMLRNATSKINQYNMIAKNSILAISLILSDIADKPKEYLEDSGFTSISDYAETMFNYKKAYTYKLIKISKFISIKSKDNEVIQVKDLINNEINTDYYIDVLKDSDGFEFSPSQMLELIPLTVEQISANFNELDSSLTCKELRVIVKNIINPPIETTGDSKEYTEDNQEENKDEEKMELTDKDRLLQMLEICSGMENEDIKDKIINVFQKSLKLLEK